MKMINDPPARHRILGEAWRKLNGLPGKQAEQDILVELTMHNFRLGHAYCPVSFHDYFMHTGIMWPIKNNEENT